MEKVNGGYLFRAFRTDTKSKILTFMNFFVFFRQVLYHAWYKKPKSLENNFFRVNAGAGFILFILTMLVK